MGAVMKASVLAIAFGLVVACGMPALAQTDRYLSADAIRQSVIGKTIASTTHRGYPYTMHLNSDGTGTNIFSQKTEEALTWDIAGDVLCFHGKMSGTECNRVRATNSGFDFVDSKSGAVNNSYSLQ